MNKTHLSISTEKECILPRYARIIGIVIVAIIMVFGAVGNSAVCIILRKFKTRFNMVSHLFVMNIAVSDLLISLTVIPFDIVYWTTFPVFSLGPKLCRLWNALYFTFLAASSIGVCFIGIDIFLAVTKPLHYAAIVTTRKAYFAMTSAWIWSITVGILIYFFQEEPPKNEYLFELNPSAYGLYLIVHIAIPSMFVPLLYAKLFCIARQHAKRVQPIAAVKTENSRCNQQKLSIKRQLSMARTFFLITTGFFFCWYPFLVVQMFYVFKLEDRVDWCKLETADTIVCWFSYIQCCINPILYVFRRKIIRQTIQNHCTQQHERRNCTKSIKSLTG